MGLFSFVKNAGAKIFGAGDSDDKKAVAVMDHLHQFNLRSDGITAIYSNGAVTLSGEVDNELERKRIVATIGNIDGVESIDDNITIAGTPEKEVAGAEVRFYEVKSGDTLSGIAQEMYGDGSLYPQIFEANRPMLDDPDKIYPGQKLVIPAQEK